MTLELLRQRWEAVDPVPALKAGRFATKRLFLLNGHEEARSGDTFLQEVEKYLPGAKCLPIHLPHTIAFPHTFAYTLLPFRARQIARLFLSALSVKG